MSAASLTFQDVGIGGNQPLLSLRLHYSAMMDDRLSNHTLALADADRANRARHALTPRPTFRAYRFDWTHYAW